MAEGDVAPKTGGGITGFLGKQTAGLPNWAWLLVVGAGIAAAIIIPKLINQGGSSASNPTDTSGTGLGLAIDPTTGLPYAVQGLVPSGAMAGTDGNTSSIPDTTGMTSTSTPQPVADTSVPARQQPPTYSTRQNITSGAGAGATNVPVRQTPGGQVIGSIGFGQRIRITGTPVSGPNNFGPKTPTGTGSTLWYPVSGGYVSAFDVMQSGVGSTGPSWPTSSIRTRHLNIA
jgi:hypothetical protein